MRFCTLALAMASVAAAVGAQEGVQKRNETSLAASTAAAPPPGRHAADGPQAASARIQRRGAVSRRAPGRRRTGSVTSDVGSTSSHEGEPTAVFMGGIATRRGKSMVVPGVNGCALVFFFDGGGDKITGGHLTADNVGAEARAAAEKARRDGNSASAVPVRAAVAADLDAIVRAVSAVFPHATIDKELYDEHVCSDQGWNFSATNGKTTLTKTLQD